MMSYPRLDSEICASRSCNLSRSHLGFRMLNPTGCESNAERASCELRNSKR